jgi:hypothetical protein
MGQNPQPSPEELEFIYGLLHRGLSNLDIQEDMQDREFPRRTSSRFFRQRRREFDAARKVLDQTAIARSDPLLNEKRRHHEEELRAALEELKLDPTADISDGWSWWEEGPREIPNSYFYSEMKIPETLNVQFLVQHLRPDDAILTSREGAVQTYADAVEARAALSAQMIDQIHSAGFVMRVDSSQRVPGVADGFHVTFSDCLEGSPWYLNESDPYRREPIDGPQGALYKQLFGGLLIGVGDADLLDGIEALHRDLIFAIREGRFAGKASEIRQRDKRYREAATDLSRLIDIRSKQAVFGVDPCEVCDAWVGL